MYTDSYGIEYGEPCHVCGYEGIDQHADDCRAAR